MKTKEGMSLENIRAMSTDIHVNCKKFHESICRSYQILDKVIQLLELGTPNEVILEIIEDCRNAPPIIYDWDKHYNENFPEKNSP